MHLQNKKHIWKFFVFVLFFLLVIPVNGFADALLNEVKYLSIESMISTVLNKNLDIAMVEEKLGIAKNALKQTNALFLPRVYLYSEAKTGDSPSSYLFKTIDQRNFLPGTDFNAPGTFENIEAGLRFRMNLFHGGRDKVSINMARSHVMEVKSLTHQTKNIMVSSGIRLFFSILKAKAYIDIAKQSVETLEENLRIMKIRFQGGGILRSDLLSLEVRLTQAKSDLIHSKNAYAIALTGLNSLLGNLPDTSLSLLENCSCPFTFPETYQEAIDTALKHRPEILMAAQMAEKARCRIKGAKGQYLPSLDLEGAWYTDADRFKFGKKSNNYILGLSMNWDLYTGNTTNLEILSAQKSLTLAINNMEKVRLSIYQEVKQAYLRHEDAVQRLAVTKKSVEMAEESLELISRRYKGGSEPVTRYLETELALNQSRMNQTAAFYDEKIALSDMAMAIGVLSRIWSSESD